MPDGNPFDPLNIHDTLDSAIKALPNGARGGVFIDGTYRDGKTGAEIVVVTKIGSHFTIAGTGTYDGKHVAGKVTGEILW